MENRKLRIGVFGGARGRTMIDVLLNHPDTNQVRKSNGLKMTSSEKKQLIEQLEAKMRKAAKMLEYEIAAQLRDEIIRLRGEK